MTTAITDVANARYTTKAYDPARKISAEDMEMVKDLLRLSPSSVNSQPWKFIIATTDEGKARVAKGAEAGFAFNAPSIKAASAVVVFASLKHADEAYLERLLEKEEADGRFPDVEVQKPAMRNGRGYFVGLHQDEIGDGEEWMARQVYLNLGNFLLGVGALGINATAMEGINTAVLDEEFGLAEQGYQSLFAVTLGYSDPEADYNAALPMSHWDNADIITEI